MRRKRSDSAEAAVEALQSAEQTIQPPAHLRLRERDLPFWVGIVRARASEEWTDVDLAHAGNLARCMADIERIQAEIDAEGDTLTNDRGTVVMNPKHSLLETLSRRSIALCRSLQVHAHALQGDSREQKKRAETRKGAQATAQRFNDEDLLAAPIH